MHEVDYSKKWKVLSAIGVGVLLATIDGSIVNIALPTIRQQLSTTLPVVQWVAVGYLLTLATLTLGVGRWGDIVGKKRIYTAGFVVFTVASGLCGLAPTVGALIAFRVLQAVGAVMVLALGSAILTEAFPPSERGKALGLIGTFVSVGIITGPVVGGLLIAAFDWRAIFFVNLPVGAIGVWLSIRHVPDTPPAGGQRFDVAGAAALSTALLCVALAVTAGQTAGYRSPAILALFAVGLLAGLVFVRIERRVSSPMLDLRLLRDPVLAVSIASGYLVFVALSAVFFLLPFYLEGVLGYDTRMTGLALGIAPLVLGVVSPLSGSWSDRIGIRKITMLGLVVLAVSFAAFRTLGTDTSFLTFAALAIPVGLGVGLFQSPNNSAIMGAVPREYMGVAGGILTLTRLLGQVSGIAILGSVWAARVTARAGGSLTGDAASAPPEIQVAGIHDTALVMFAVVLVGMAVTAWGLRQERALPAAS
ncbi:MAG: MFS transporter [Acidimicrobiia bacterium]|nr:MFS transporter [Acidimicrobiia bacterium]MDH5293539.1 MFS transporter [Acidimicrobiia bacterium]